MQPDLRETAGIERQTPLAAVGEAPNAGGDAGRWLRNLTIAAAAGAFMALIGAFETGAVPLGLRLLYWVPIMIAGGLLGGLMSLVVGRLLNAESNVWLFGAVLAVAISVPATLLVWGYTALFFGGMRRLDILPAFALNVLLVSVAMTALMIIANQPGRMTHALPPSAPPAPPRFLDRLPAKLRGADIYAVSAEDHYLRLHTSKGSDLILMRLADALAELEGLEGAQTHRSWWVARDAVEGVRRDGDRATLTLKGGAIAPVSRPNVRALREAGWF